MNRNEISPDRVYFNNYETKAFGDIHWIRKAEALIASAKLLEPSVLGFWDSVREQREGKRNHPLPDQYQGPYFMLMSYALENLLKAAIIRIRSYEFKREFRDKKTFPKILRSHKLFKLSQEANLTVSIEEEDILRRLTRSATWHGRYPVPLFYRNLEGSENFSDGKKYSTSWFGNEDINRINQFLINIKKKMNITG